MKPEELLMFDLLFLLVSMAIGLVIGIVLLPWRKKMNAGGELSFLAAFTLLAIPAVRFHLARGQGLP
jgi:hypothetical protein